jgi:hypothetical protein
MNNDLIQYLERLSNTNAPTPVNYTAQLTQMLDQTTQLQEEATKSSPRAPSYRTRKRKKGDGPMVETNEYISSPVPGNTLSLERAAGRPRAKSAVPSLDSPNTPEDMFRLVQRQKDEIQRLLQMNQELQRENVFLKNNPSPSNHSTHRTSPLHSPLQPGTPQATTQHYASLMSMPSSTASIGEALDMNAAVQHLHQATTQLQNMHPFSTIAPSYPPSSASTLNSYAPSMVSNSTITPSSSVSFTPQLPSQSFQNNGHQLFQPGQLFSQAVLSPPLPTFNISAPVIQTSLGSLSSPVLTSPVQWQSPTQNISEHAMRNNQTLLQSQALLQSSQSLLQNNLQNDQFSQYSVDEANRLEEMRRYQRQKDEVVRNLTLQRERARTGPSTF